MNTNLAEAVEILVGQINGYESDTFSSAGVSMDRGLAERLAARLIHAKLFDEEGLPFIDGGDLAYAHAQLLVRGEANKRWYILTDGSEIIAEKLMTDDEYEDENRKVFIATDGNMDWALRID